MGRIQIYHVCKREEDARLLANCFDKSQHIIEVRWISAGNFAESDLCEMLRRQRPPVPSIVVLDGASFEESIWNVLESLRQRICDRYVEFVVTAAVGVDEARPITPMPNLTFMRATELPHAESLAVRTQVEATSKSH
jgi:hypothetical protein